MKLIQDVKADAKSSEDKKTKSTSNVEPKFRLSEEGKIIKCLPNLKIMLEMEPGFNSLRFNDFTKEIEHNGQPINDLFINETLYYISFNYGMEFSKDDILTVLSLLSNSRKYHPIKQMIESEEWDGNIRAESIFIDYLGAPDDVYTRAIARKWLTGAVARIYEPAIKFEMVPILQGKQGLGKSTLASKLGGNFFSDSLQGLGNSKDDYQHLIGNWIIELGELSAMNKTSIEKMKGFISARYDKIRLPYGRLVERFERTSVFIGTTNEVEFLPDMTGNRRFLPIPIGQNQPKKNVFDLDKGTIQQIFAEAYSLYKDGEVLYLESGTQEFELSLDYQNNAQSQAFDVEMMDDYLSMPVGCDWDNVDLFGKRIYYQRYMDSGKVDGEAQITKTTTKEMLWTVFKLEPTHKDAHRTIKKIKLYLDSLDDWKYTNVWINGKQQKGYKKGRK